MNTKKIKEEMDITHRLIECMNCLIKTNESKGKNCASKNKKKKSAA